MAGVTGTESSPPSTTATATATASRPPVEEEAKNTSNVEEAKCLESGEAAAARTPGGGDIGRAWNDGEGEVKVEGTGWGREKQGSGVKAANAQVALINVEGMTCAICVGIVEKLLGRYG